MKKNREIDLAEPVIEGSYHSLEVRLAGVLSQTRRKGKQCVYGLM